METDHAPSLGRFIRSRKRKDGTDHVFMSVPSHLRPAGWLETIVLPEEGSCYGRLDEPKFLKRVRKDAMRLNERLDARREEERIYQTDPRRNARALAEIYLRTHRYRELSAPRLYRNKRDAMIFVQWVERRGDPDFVTLMKPDFEDFLSIYNDRPATKIELRSLLNILCTEAIEAGWRSDNPVRKLSWRAPTPKEQVVLWDEKSVAIYGQMARQMGQPGLAALIEVGFHVGQRVGDLREAKHRVNFSGTHFRMKQSKTGETVNVPLQRRLCELIKSVQLEGSSYLFNDGDTGQGFTAQNLSLRFAEVRHALTQAGAPKLLLRTLRHSLICQMVIAQVQPLQIAAVTGHRLGRVQRIIERYAVDQYGFGAAAMKQLNRSKGGSDDDFDEADPEFRDWDADGAPKSVYSPPPEDPARPARWLGAAIGQHRNKYVIPSELIAWQEAESDEDAA
jgi:hypothetical protein